ncbi:hypothetical protein EYF80_002300 [Liparis tanakae]|uniref:Uncharacterized protein n=1 Tax=Liparis tanakae TaxID=230148 RepID=A0A4Z2JCS6_9TELE|nr:hypothetical protein EYF80_002300 [Liparis tanakae]
MDLPAAPGALSAEAHLLLHRSYLCRCISADSPLGHGAQTVSRAPPHAAVTLSIQSHSISTSCAERRTANNKHTASRSITRHIFSEA